MATNAPKVPKSRRISPRIEPTLLAELELLRESRFESLSNVARRLLVEAIGRAKNSALMEPKR